MSSTEVRKNSKAKANLVAFWEWFKSAAWLQVLLIVGVVVAVVVSIPYIIRAIPTDSDSDFFESKQITYDRLVNDLISGKDTKASAGNLGNGTGAIGDTEEGFVVFFYKDNCSVCDDMESNVEKWYNNFNEEFKADLKLYTINVGWVPGESEESSKAEGTDPIDYQNKDISLQQQTDLLVGGDGVTSLVDVYYDQPAKYYNSSYGEDKRNDLLTPLTTIGGGTMPTPTMVRYERAKGSTDPYQPTRVLFGLMGSLSASNADDVSVVLNDLFLFRPYTVA